MADAIDLDKRTLLSLSGYRGSKPVVGRIEGDEFRLHWRRYWHNSFGPILFARFTAQGKGSLIEGYWDMSKSTRAFTRVWLILVILMGTPVFFSTLKCAANASCTGRDALWVGLLVPPGMLLFGWLLPHFGAALIFHERKRITNLLQQTLVAGQTPSPNYERTWTSTLDNYSLRV